MPSPVIGRVGPPPERLADLAAVFSRHLRAEGCAPRTVVLYNQSIRLFSDWLAANDRPLTTESMTRRALEAHLADLADRVAPNTVRTRFRGLRRFARWLALEGELPGNPLDGVKQPTAPEAPVAILTDEEVTRLLKACAGTDFAARRNEAIVRLFLDTGMRIAEMAGLTLDDLDLDLEVAHVLGKGSRRRACPFGPRTARALDRYLRQRRGHKLATRPALFLGQRGALSRDGLDELLRMLAVKAGVQHLHAHRFRHTFSHRWLAAGGQERDLMRLNGWRSPEMLSRYASSTADVRAREAHRRMALGETL